MKQYSEQYPIERMSKVLRVSRSGYYAWRKRPESSRSARHRQLSKMIKKAFEESGETYGAIRIRYDLIEQGECIGKNTIALLMRNEKLVPRPVRKFRVTTDSRKTIAFPNHLDQQFQVDQPNVSWVSDITAIPTREGWLYLCVFLDLFSRAVIGWSMSHRINGDLVTDALAIALANRSVSNLLTVHSDQGSQYTSDQYQQMLKTHGARCSMSRKGNCWDNAVAESFFHSLKTERTHHENYATRTHAKLRVFDYIEVFYNRQRRHSSLGYLTPLAFEQRSN